MQPPAHMPPARRRLARGLLLGGVVVLVAGLLAIDAGVLLLLIGPVGGVKGAGVILTGMGAVGAGVGLLWLGRRLVGAEPPAR